MADKKLSDRKKDEIEALARGWGKLLAEQAYPKGVGLDVDIFMIEEVAVTAAKALVQGAVETATRQQADHFDGQQPCPGCGRLHETKRRARPVQVRGGTTASLDEPVAHCSTCRRDFFPSASGAEDRRSCL